jgi:predicted outer membrane repeat protein
VKILALFSALFLFSFCDVAFAQDTINSWDIIRSSYSQAADNQTLTIGQDITADSNSSIPNAGDWNSITLAGSETVRTIDANQNSGFSFSKSGQTLNIEDLVFTNFKSDGDGSVILSATNGSKISIIQATATFNNNSSQNGGSVSLSLTTSLETSGAIVSFASNSASTAGGALFVSDSNLNFGNSKIVFEDNSAGSHGGAIYIGETSTLSFVNSNLVFSNNIDSSNNTAVYFKDDSSTMTISGGSIEFSSKLDNWRFTNNLESIDFKPLEIRFTANSHSNGVNVAMIDFSEVVFKSSLTYTTATGNTSANNGGFLNLINSDSMSFTSGINFSSNTAENFGGAVYLNDKSSLIFNSTAKFDSNISTHSGGAIYAENGNLIEFNGDKEIIFANNISSAGLGGAIFVKDSTITFNGFGNFNTNVAASSGGAVYAASGSSLSFNATGGDIIFQDNKITYTAEEVDTSKPNDFFLESNVVLNFSGSSNTVISGGILSASNSSDIVINKTGMGILAFGGENEIYGKLNIMEGSLRILPTLESDATLHSNIFKEMTISKNAKFDMANGTVTIANIEKLTLQGDDNDSNSSAVFDVWLYKDNERKNNDKVNSSSVTINNAIVELNIVNKVKIGVYKNVEFEIITSTSDQNLYVDLDSIKAKIVNNDKLKVAIVTDEANKNIIASIAGENSSCFSTIDYLSTDEQNIANVLDKLSVTIDENSKLFNLIDEVWDGENDDLEPNKLFLSQASGHFLSNVIRGTAMGNEYRDVYLKMSGIQNDRDNYWTQAIGGNEQYVASSSSAFVHHKNNSYGIMAGADKYLFSNVRIGLFGKYAKNSITEGGSAADIDSIGGGIYAGFFGRLFELKALVSQMNNKYDTSRNINIYSKYLEGNTANANFTGSSFGADVEAAVKLDLGKNIILSYFTGVELKDITYESFKESGAYPLALYVKDDARYVRNTARFGGRIMYSNNNNFCFYWHIEGLYLLKGESVDLKTSLIADDNNFQFVSNGIDGNKEKVFSMNVGFGISQNVTENLKLYLTGSCYGALGYKNINGVLGINYAVGGAKARKESQDKLNQNTDDEDLQKNNSFNQTMPPIQNFYWAF